MERVESVQSCVKRFERKLGIYCILKGDCVFITSFLSELAFLEIVRHIFQLNFE